MSVSKQASIQWLAITLPSLETDATDKLNLGSKCSTSCIAHSESFRHSLGSVKVYTQLLHQIWFSDGIVYQEVENASCHFRGELCFAWWIRSQAHSFMRTN